MLDWVKNRIEERTTWDGSVLIVAGVCFLIFKPLATIVAYGAIAYGVWTICKKEN